MEWMLYGMAATLLLFALALLICYQRLKFLRNEMDVLTRRVASQLDDISGLCSAALNVDQRLVQDEKRLGELFDWMEGQKTEDKLKQPYHSAISLVKRGADVAQLMAECGISHEEASLLLRLHGSGSSR